MKNLVIAVLSIAIFFYMFEAYPSAKRWMILDTQEFIVQFRGDDEGQNLKLLPYSDLCMKVAS